MDLRKLKTLIDLVSESNVSELEITEADGKVRIVKAGAAPVVMMQAAPQAAPVAAAAAAPAAVEAAPVVAAPAVETGHIVTSPMVGTVYIAPEPGSKPFVEIGDTVREGQTVVIIEAMKHLNQIPAPRAGKVTAILVENGQPIEFGEPLLIIE